MTTGSMQQDQNHENQIEKQIGCMSGFLHIFDRQQVLAEKRVHSAKRLPLSPESVKSVQPKRIKEHKRLVPTEPVASLPESPDGFQASNLKFFPTSTPPRSPLPFRVFEAEGQMKSPWKFCQEMPRLSLDSRAVVDSKGSLCPREIRPDSLEGSFESQRRSISVVAKLMGIEELPSSVSSTSPETVMKPELRRSASEPRAAKNLLHSGYIDADSFQPNQSHKQSEKTSVTTNSLTNIKYSSRSQKNEYFSLRRPSPQRRTCFDSTDIFPEAKQSTMADSKKNLKLKRLDEQSKDLEALKNLLEALQLKGLLHSISRDRYRNFVYGHGSLSNDSSVVAMNRRWSAASNYRFGNVNRYSGENSPRPDRGVFDRSCRSPVRATNDKRKPLSVETQKRSSEFSESRRSSPISSPKLTPKRSGSEYHSVSNRSPRSKSPSEIGSKQKVSRMVVVEDESSSVSESSGSTTSQFDPERSKTKEYREGKSLLARCDKLLAEMNSNTESHTSSNSVLPSPVSVLDSVFDKDESSSPSPIKKRTIDLKDLTVVQDDEIWTSIFSPAASTEDEEFISGDPDFKYISEILQASKHLPVDSIAFFFLEKQQYLNENDSSNCSKLQRKLVFDTVTEILNRNKDLPPWNATLLTESSNSVKQICYEYQKMREPKTAENMMDMICTVLKNDLAGNNGWGDHPVEISEAVLYIERLIFKDLVSETIRDLAEFGGKTTVIAPRRKLVF